MLVRPLASLLVFFSLISISPGTVAAETEVRKIPVAKGLASHPVNGGRCLISDGKYQYIAFYDSAHRMTVGKRRLGETKWDFAKLPERVGWDTHNKIVLFQDRQGHLHLTGNMHCAPLRYYRTKKAGDIHSFEGIHKWTGDYENRVTYPTVFKLRDRSIYLMYRHGGSGNGMRILLGYDEETQNWTKTTSILTNGMNRRPTCNAYPIGLLEDNSGTWHIAWCWRETPDVITNFDICYAKSPDRGATWKGWDGRDLELPITPENAHVVESIKQDSGLMNGGSFAVDDRGRPYVGYTRFDKDGYNQLYVATPVDGKWKIVRLTDWNHRFYFHGRGTIPESPPTPRVSITADQKIRVSYSNRYAGVPKGQLVLTREQLLAGKPGRYVAEQAVDSGPKIPNIRAVNRGPLPPGVTHYMQQQTDSPNRDRKPEDAREPTMIYVVEIELSPSPGPQPKPAKAAEHVPIHSWHKERVENIRSETVEQVVENLANFDDAQFAHTSINDGFCPGDMSCEVRCVVNFFRVRRLYEDGLRNPGRVIPLLKDAYRKAHEVWPQVRAARLELEKDNSYSWSEPDDFHKANTRVVASTYLLAELQDHSSLPLLVAGYKLQRKWAQEMGDSWLTEVPVPRFMTLYAIHRLATTLPQDGLSTKALAARRAYVTWAEKNIPEPKVKKVTAWYADYDESDPYRRIVDPKGRTLKGQPAIRLAIYPDMLLDGTALHRGHLPEEKKKEAEWAGLLLPFVEAVEDL